MKIKHALQEYLLEIEVRKYTQKTIRSYRNNLNLFVRYLDEEEVMMDAMDAGADDFEADGDVFTIYTLPDDFNDVVANLSKYTFVSAQIEMVPQNYQKLESEEHIALMEKLIDIMEDDDDVQNIWHNWEQE